MLKLYRYGLAFDVNASFEWLMARGLSPAPISRDIRKRAASPHTGWPIRPRGSHQERIYRCEGLRAAMAIL